MGNIEGNIDKRILNLRPGRLKTAPQPTPAQKKAGWDRKKQAQRIMDKVMELQDMSYQEFLELSDDLEKHPDKHTVIEMKLVRYLAKEKFTIDFLDRHISKAPVEQVVTQPDAVPIQFIIEYPQKDNADDNGEEIQAPSPTDELS